MWRAKKMEDTGLIREAQLLRRLYKYTVTTSNYEVSLSVTPTRQQLGVL